MVFFLLFYRAAVPVSLPETARSQTNAGDVQPYTYPGSRKKSGQKPEKLQKGIPVPYMGAQKCLTCSGFTGDICGFRT